MTDAHAGVADVLANGALASLTPDGAFAADVDLVEGENTIVLTARDRVGNETTETRTVAYYDYGTAWQVSGESGRGNMNAFLRLTDSAGRSLRVDSVTAELVDESGAVTVSQPMAFDDGRYKASLGKPAGGATRCGRSWWWTASPSARRARRSCAPASPPRPADF